MNSSRKVRFSREVEVFQFEDDCVDYRKPYWEIYAVDRFRFNERIKTVEKILNPILAPSHRAKRLQNG